VDVLARPWQTESTKRFETDQFGKTMYSKTEEADRKVVDRLGELPEKRGVPRAQLALAWMLSKPFVTSPIVGAAKPNHLADAVRCTVAATHTRRDCVARRGLHTAPGTRFQLSRIDRTKRKHRSKICSPVAPPGAMMSISFESDEIILEQLRERLRSMTDAELIKFGKDVRRLAENPFQRQLEEARKEWKRRKEAAASSNRSF